MRGPRRSLRRYRVGFIALLALAWPAAGAAMSTLIDFDTLPGGGASPLFTPLADSYESLGVVFGSLDSGGGGAPQFVLAGGGNIHAGDTNSVGSTVGFHIVASFSTPARQVAADVFTGSGSGFEFAAIAIAFDDQGTEIGRIESGPSRPSFKGRLVLEDLGAISSVLWIADQSFVSSIFIDDLEFRTVPEPTTLTLLGLGITVLAAGARRT